VTLELTNREVEMLENTLTTLGITRQYSKIDPYKDDYGQLLGKLLNEKERQERRKA